MYAIAARSTDSALPGPSSTANPTSTTAGAAAVEGSAAEWRWALLLRGRAVQGAGRGMVAFLNELLFIRLTSPEDRPARMVRYATTMALAAALGPMAAAGGQRLEVVCRSEPEQ